MKCTIWKWKLIIVIPPMVQSFIIAKTSAMLACSVVAMKEVAHAALSCGSAGVPLSPNAPRTVCWRM